jgi:hypothetical protein
MSKGGMQSSRVEELICICGKSTSRIIKTSKEIISIHFTKKSTFWHIKNNKTGEIKRTFKQPELWN